MNTYRSKKSNAVQLLYEPPHSRRNDEPPQQVQVSSSVHEDLKLMAPSPAGDGAAQSNPLWRDEENERSRNSQLGQEGYDEPEEEEYRMPVVPLVACSFTVFVASFSIYNVFPYAGLMAIHFGKADDRDDAGYYAGWIAAGFMGGRTLT